MRRTLPLVAGLLLVIVGLGLWLGTGRPGPAAVASPSMVAVRSALPTTAAPASPAATPTRDPRSPIPDGYRVKIPRLAIDLPIAEGDVVRDIDQQRTPENYAFHLTGTSIPGLGSNTYLYAHARAGMFLTLWDARVGDEIFLSTPTGSTLRYLVSEVHPAVAPTDVSWVQPTPGERLTLQTSTGRNPTDPRFVVVALPAP